MHTAHRRCGPHGLALARAALALVALAPALALAQPATGGGAAASAATGNGPVAEVLILDYKFTPPVLTVRAGTTVRWLNQEKRTTHSVQFTHPPAPEGERMFPGESWLRRFDTPGRYEYTCGPHPEMKGRIDVTP
ncbi:MAG: cupredoxin domain-containing protein [Burkholderiales bacterium]|nr:cupredoxin domain-containing protein [Burkholderiales bacterium]